MPNIIAGIDPSLGRTAIVCGGPGTPHASGLKLGIFKAGAVADNLVGRLARWRGLATNIRNFIIANEVQAIFIEGYSYGSQGQAVLDLAEFGGVLRMALLSLGTPIVEIPPTSLKKFITGKGNAGKDLVVATLARQCEITYEKNDEYDALGLWLMGRVYLDADYATNQTQLEAVKALHEAR